ncbi:MAG: phytoene desaturase family protein [Jatrophihabitans sp.]
MVATRDDSVPDAVVIGAGHNGLVAANLLAEAGWSVVVCEGAPEVGGAVASAEVTAPGFGTDLFSAFYPLAVASPVLSALRLADHGLRWSHAPAVFSHVLPDGRSATVWRDAARTAESLDRFAPGDGDAWLRLTAQWDRIGAQVIDSVLRPFPPITSAARLLHRTSLAEALRLARMAAQPVRRFGEETFRGAGGPLLFAGNALHADLAPDGAGSALYGWLLCMLAHSHGFPVPVGGSGALIDALVARLHTHGGEIRTNCRVDAVEVAAGRAAAVVLESGERLAARRAVLADVTAPHLFSALVGDRHLPTRLVEDVSKFQWDTPTVKVNWALERPIPWSDADAGGAGTVHLGVDMDGLTDYAADLATRRTPTRPFVLLGQMTTADPTRSPQGTESAWAYTHLPTGRIYDAAGIAEHVELVESVVERHAAGFTSAIIGRHSQSPAQLQEHDANLVGGAINGGTAQLHQQLVFRPIPGLAGPDTPIDRLYLAASSAHPGGGVHGACGANAALMALARDRVTGRVRRAVRSRLMQRIYRPER